MTKRIPDYLKLHRDPAERHSVVADEIESNEGTLVNQICRDFEAACGWPLRFVPARNAAEAYLPADPLWSAPIDLGAGTSPGYLTISAIAAKQSDSSRSTSARPQSKKKLAGKNLEQAKALAGDVARLLNELGAARRAIWRREAELAAGVPVVSRPDEAAHLAERLESVLHGGAEAVGGTSAGLYMLDAATTELKLRACWGLPSKRLVDPPRPLRGAIADLEALTGHAVVLEDDAVVSYWSPPEPCRAAVRVPVSTPSTILGTLWIFSDRPRKFSDRETNLIEIIAGRLASDLEREMLLAEGAEIQRARRWGSDSQAARDERLASVVPQIDGWEIAGATRASSSDWRSGFGVPFSDSSLVETGDFFDWQPLEDGSLLAFVVDPVDGGERASARAVDLRGALRVQNSSEPDLGNLLDEANRTICSGSTGDRFAAVLTVRIAAADRRLRYASAGQVGGLLLSGGTAMPLARGGAPLGVEAASRYGEQSVEVPPGGAVVLFSNGLGESHGHDGRPLAERLLGETLLPLVESGRSAAEIARRAMELLENECPQSDEEAALIVIRRAK